MLGGWNLWSYRVWELRLDWGWSWRDGGVLGSFESWNWEDSSF